MEGLAECAGEDVELGFFEGEPGPDAYGFAWVDADGNAAAFPIPTEEAIGLRAGARGDCVPGGLLLSDVKLHVVDPVDPLYEPTPTPLPGSERASFVWGEGVDAHRSVLVGESVNLSVEGLSACAGEEVQVGFYAGLFGADLFARVFIDAAGRATVALTPTETTGDQRAGAVGDCLAYGFLVSDWAFFANEPPRDGEDFGYTPTPVTPQPPVVGSGVSADDRGTAWAWALIAGFAAVALGGAILAWLRR